MRKPIFATYLIIASFSVLAESAPTVGIVYNTKETNSITFRCTSIETSTIECAFVQTRVLPAFKVENIEKSIENARNEFKQGIKLTKKDCIQYNEIFTDLKNKESTQQNKTSKATAKTEYEDDISSLKAVLAFCAKSTEENFIEIAKLNYSKLSRTCRASSNTFVQNYKLLPETGVWIADSNPVGDCGIVDLSRFESDKSLGKNFTGWSFISKKAITNPKGTLFLGQPCSGLDESEYIFNWRNITWPMQCDYIEFSPI
ncbi:hypothetical protein [Pseudomonas sp. HS6]|uniref:hypothetical protein n=1 Tax=Pseudomonas sp. HS6 TaxID=2850559 RepID=UPI002019BD13|nr:hypothetical protein [Pseudomonas sp. HS6]UQS16766.1 hypothetical protein JJN09_07900 [Pseudomonas sp. HS6]